DKQEADLWLLNSCTVKSPAEDHFRNEIKLARQLEKYIVVAGCVPQGQPKADYMQGLSVVGVQQIDRVLEVVEETLKGHSVRCLNQCTYCKTKHARGELGSYPPDEIVARAVQSFQEGVVEIWLTSEDLGAYGHDIGVTLPELLWRLVDEIAKILQHPRVYSFLHVPVQSASDSVLMDMKREYCQADFRHVADYLKE
ncbi:CDKAL-like protein, partial [Mya arenaria]